MTATTDITGLILAGGQGVRMGGLDKGLQRLSGDTLVAHVLRRFAPQVGEIAVNANRNLPTYQEFGVPVWSDEELDGVPGFAGPLAGLYTGLVHCRTPYLASVPCDAPFLPLDLVQPLLAALETANADLAVAATGAPDNVFSRHTQPVFCLLKVTLLPQLRQFLQQGGRKVDAWHATLNTTAVHFSDAAAFCNINTPDELRQYGVGL